MACWPITFSTGVKARRDGGAERGGRGDVGILVSGDVQALSARLLYASDRKGPCRTVQAGSGYWSQDAATQVLGLQEFPLALWIRWPGGKEQTVPIRDQEWTVHVGFEK